MAEVTKEEAAQLFFSGDYDHLSLKEFREQFPLKTVDPIEISDEQFLNLLIKDPSWCSFYHRRRVVDLLPKLTAAYIREEARLKRG